MMASMKNIGQILYLISLIMAQYVPGLHGQESQLELTICITNVSPERGQLVIDLYADPESFRKEHPLQRIILPKKEGLSTYKTSVKLIPGRYAIATFDDRNMNNTIDRNFIGFPLEGFGFYGHDKLPLKKPCFKTISFELGKENKGVFITMQYR